MFGLQRLSCIVGWGIGGSDSFLRGTLAGNGLPFDRTVNKR
jgi:hypothetical protein